MKTAINFIMTRLQEEFPSQMRDIYESNQLLAEDICIKANNIFKEQIIEAHLSGQELADWGTGRLDDCAKEYYNETYKK